MVLFSLWVLDYFKRKGKGKKSVLDKFKLLFKIVIKLF